MRLTSSQLPCGIHHPPPDQVVERGAPEHRLLAAGVHRDVAADAGRVERGRIDGEHQAGLLCRLGHPPRHHAGLREHGRDFLRDARAGRPYSTAESFSSFSVLMIADIGGERDAPPV